jgi:hypothetical protein
MSGTYSLQIPRSNQERNAPNYEKQQTSEKGGNDDERYSGREE